MAEPPSDLLCFRKQMRKFASPSPACSPFRKKFAIFRATSSLPALQAQLRKTGRTIPGQTALQEQMKSLTASPGLLAFQEQMRTLAERSTGVLSAYNEQMRNVREGRHTFWLCKINYRWRRTRLHLRNALSVAGWAGRFPTATVFEPLFAERLVALREPKVNPLPSSERRWQSTLRLQPMNSLTCHPYQQRSLIFLIV